MTFTGQTATIAFELSKQLQTDVNRSTHFRPVVDSICDGVHCHRSATDEIATKIYLSELMKFSQETSNLTDVITD